MAQVTHAYEWKGRTVIDPEGDKIGKLEELYADPATGEPEWAAVSTGLFGSKRSFVPLREAGPAGENVQVPYQTSQVKDAPRIDPDGELNLEEERNLFAHYGFTHPGPAADEACR